MNSSTKSSGSPSAVIGASGVALMHITWVLEVLMFKPTCLANLLNLSVFSCTWQRVVERAARSSAKSRSSSWEKSVYCMPLGLSAVVLCMIQSMATSKKMGEMTHPRCMPDSTQNHSDRFTSTMTLHPCAVALTWWGGLRVSVTLVRYTEKVYNIPSSGE